MAATSVMPALQRLGVNRLLGVDLAADASAVSPQRSPYSVNMLRSVPGSVRKRPGFVQVAAYGGTIHGCYMLGDTAILHAGNKLYADGEPIEGTVGDVHSRGCCFGGKLYLLDGREFWQVYFQEDTWKLQPVSESAYLPRIAISKNPNGSGGAALEDVNLLSDAWCESFYAAPGEVVYQLEFGGLDDTPVSVRQICAAADGGTQEKTLTEGVDFTVERTAGTVTFLSAPEISPVEGEDNIFITASRDRSEARRRITQADVCTLYGKPGTGMRLFVTGAPEWKNRDFWSAADDPAYFSEFAYSVLGADDERIVGYSLLGDSLAAHKSGADGAVWVRTPSVEEQRDALGNPRQVFTFRSGNVITGYGTLAKDSFAVLGDEPLFFTAQGIFALTAAELTGVRCQQRRSGYIDPQLCAEPNPEKAQAAVWQDFYLLALNGRVYCLDGLQKSYSSAAPKSSFRYECYVLEDIPAERLWVQGGQLWFGTADGRVCVFAQGESLTDYTDRLDGCAPRPIRAVWETPDIVGSTFYREKRFRYLAARILPAAATSLMAWIRVEGVWHPLRSEAFQARHFSFSGMTFSKLCFSCDAAGKTLGQRLRCGRPDKVRIRFENSQANEPFGLLGWALEYTEGRRHRR